MIIGIFQRHYKIYKGASFIPLHSEKPDSFTTFIGNNGSGKSSILESLDYFFNSREFNVNNSSVKSEAFVAPLFLLSDDQLKLFNSSNQELIREVSKFLWNIDANKDSNFKSYRKFFDFRDNQVSYLKEKYFLFTIAREYNNGNKYFFTFTSRILLNIKQNIPRDFNKNDHSKLLTDLNKLFSYIYIPVETSIEDFLKLEETGMQNLINKKITTKIDDTLTKKQIEDSSSRKKNVSLLDIINRDLKEYIDLVEKQIKEIDGSYSFKMKSQSKQNLTANDLREQIIYSYISRRKLKKDDKPIKNLSAGERKQALINVAYSLIHGNDKREKNIIFAVDEPESSLHISNCFNQFDRIEEISKSENCQVITTTHWYGSLPIINDGSLVHLDMNEKKQPTFKLFSFKNYFEERENHPDDINLKSFYDLTSSLVSSMRHHDTNWLIVEGTSDLNYIKRNLNKDTIKILPVGGCAVVKKLYDFLYVPLSQNKEGKNLNSKVFCLTDTDEEGSYELINNSCNKHNNIVCKRLNFTSNGISLVKDNDYKRCPTEIENSVYSKDFFKALNAVYKKIKRQNLEDKFDVVESNHSMIVGDDSFIVYKGNASEQKKEKKEIMKFINENKINISYEYARLDNVTQLQWMKEINDYFTIT